MAIHAQKLTKQFGQGDTAFLALRGIDLDVPDGEILFVKGPSGSGKTTLLSILGCVLRATTGHAEVLGRDVGAMSEVELAEFRLFNMGFVFQGHNLLNSLTAHGNVRLPLMLRGMPMAQADVRAAEELEAVGLADKLDSLPRDLSGGQRQRVAIARATAGEPALLLADEPTASLDAASGQDVMGLLAGLARDRGTTVLVVTHDPRIFTYADRIVSIEDGQLFHEDSP